MTDKIRGFEKISFKEFQKNVTKDKYPNRGAKNIYDSIKMPKRATSKSAGYDCYSPFAFLLKPNESIEIPTGIKVYMPDDNMLKVYPRSGLGFKHFIRLANTVGIIDSDYYNNNDNEGHIFVKIRNEGDDEVYINKNKAICQFIFEKYYLTDDDNFNGEKRNGGFGHTDKKM